MKGILVAGGCGRRLHPMTKVTSKHLLPVYNKPMIYYPLSVLMLARIREILIISTPEHLPDVHKLLGNGENWGLRLSYQEQETPRGVAEAFILGEKFIAGNDVALILGDNIIHSNGLQNLLARSRAEFSRRRGCFLFASRASNPREYGVIEIGLNGLVLSIEEKPERPRSNYVNVGLSFYDDRATAFAKTLSPSPRGELEITDLNRVYLEAGALRAENLGRGTMWMDMGTPERLLEAANFVHSFESRRDVKLADLDEIARLLQLDAD